MAFAVFDFFKSQHRAISIETVYNYLAWLEEAFIIYRCNRYDIQGKNVLKSQGKYYLSDIGFKFSQFGYLPKAIAAVLENLVYLELRCRGFLCILENLQIKKLILLPQNRSKRFMFKFAELCQKIPTEKWEI